MKNINYYMALPYKMEIVEDKDEGGYVVSYPDLPGCITCGETIWTVGGKLGKAGKTISTTASYNQWTTFVFKIHM